MATRTLAVRDNPRLAKVKATDAAETAFTAPTYSLTKPANDGVIDLRRFGTIPEWLFLVPFGRGDANDVFEMWVTGWRRLAAGYLPIRTSKFTCTLSAFVGVAGGTLVVADKVCDTITATEGISNVSYELYSPEDDTPAHVLLRPNGCDLVEFHFDATTGDPTGMNCLWARL
jgi:hypothetical protein